MEDNLGFREFVFQLWNVLKDGTAKLICGVFSLFHGSIDCEGLGDGFGLGFLFEYLYKICKCLLLRCQPIGTKRRLSRRFIFAEQIFKFVFFLFC